MATNSNEKPKIYGHCKAGSDWETVHREEFENRVSAVEQRGIERMTFRFSKVTFEQMVDIMKRYGKRMDTWREYDGVQKKGLFGRVQVSLGEGSVSSSYPYIITITNATTTKTITKEDWTEENVGNYFGSYIHGEMVHDTVLK